MTQTTATIESQRLDELEQEYESRGYRVLRGPNRSSLPAFLSSFRPDMVALSPTDNVVVEVKASSTLLKSEYLSSLSQAVNAQQGWRFELVVPHSPQSLLDDGGEELDDDGIRDYLAHARVLAATEEHEAAALLTWAAAEAALRRVARSHGIILERDQPTFILNTLYSVGLLEEAEYQPLKEGLQRRNFLIHGYRPPQPVNGSNIRLLEVVVKLLNLKDSLDEEEGTM